MQPTTLLTLLAATFATTVSAAPSSPAPLEARQDVGLIYARFYGDGGCHGDWLDDIVFPQNTDACTNNGIVADYHSVDFLNNTATRTLRVYSLSNCDESGNHFDLAPKKLGCFAQHVGSAKFI
ncbi:hypothetical protein DM02DRAFT_619280 [Periconia macrospinosa]|uniref:Uncharacterized protein n=1 Tax=Periconia macrospinosa TaxID=97972 RepID=A0A2V1D5U7_9PLEO|nr:hypothetical protein DM02DRAFT_619280 [Periconia macrospinosa]